MTQTRKRLLAASSLCVEARPALLGLLRAGQKRWGGITVAVVGGAEAMAEQWQQWGAAFVCNQRSDPNIRVPTEGSLRRFPVIRSQDRIPTVESY